MRKGRKLFAVILSVMAILLTGCSASNTVQNSSIASVTSEAATSGSSQAYSQAASDVSTDNMTAITSETSTIAINTKFTASDLEVGYDENTAVKIILSGNSIESSGDGVSLKDSTVTISSEGTYIISGTLQEGQIIVDAGDKDKVQLVLNGASINCADSAPIYIKNADKVFITLADGSENTLTDGTEYVQTDDNTVDSVVFSKADITFNGNGVLTVTGNYKHGICAKNELCFTGGTYHITAVKDAINSNNGVKIKDGTFTLSAQIGNGIQSKNSEDTTQGFVYICGGEITVKECKEGIEGTAIIIEGGTINIKAQDDGMNASNAASAASEAFNGGGNGNMFENDTNCYISISGGKLSIDASGDGIDSNGSLYISGGSIYVSGPTGDGDGALDYNGTADITGGIIVAAGSIGMAQGFSDTSTQCSILNNLSSSCEAGTEITLTDEDANVVAAFTPGKQYQSVIISTPELTRDKTYTLTCGNQTADLALSSIVTSNGQQMGGPGMGGNPGERMNGAPNK